MKMIKLWIVSWFALLLAACGGEGSGLPAQDGGGNPLPGVVSLQLTPAKAHVPIDFSLQYVAEALLADGSVTDVTGNPSVFWSSSNLAVARIDNRGLATGVSPGTVTITA
ncbi:TPA: Ig-like domain-containing protein, partial [Aeromonas dhakensis]|nr:Ig-like domain-containing protein [Aeromonas dhakensis]